MKIVKTSIAVVLTIMLTACSDSPQQADPDFRPQDKIAHFSPDDGPVVLIDEAHNNFLTASGRYKPFLKVLASDGFRVGSNTKKFTENELKRADIIVIANALDKNRTDWLPPYGKALSQNEVEALKNWIEQGGSLFLVADHAPFPKVIDNLALELGFKFSNGHVGDATFSKSNYSLAEHTITYTNKEKQDADIKPLLFQNLDVDTNEVQQVRSFGGSAFKAPEKAVSLLNLGIRAVSMEPVIPFQINSDTPRISMDGWSQGAIVEIGEGRIAVFSEGMMFSSQIDRNTGKKHGLRSVGAEQNEEFLLNVMRWLANRG